MDVDIQNNVNKSIDKYDKQTVNSYDSHSDFQQSFSNSDCDNEHRKLMIAEDDESSDKQLSSKNIEDENRSKGEGLILKESTSYSAEKPLTIANMSSNSISGNCFLQPHDLSINGGKLTDQSNEKNSKENPEESLLPSENSSKRKRGRPRKIITYIEREFQEEPMEKRPRGRPRKTFSIEKEIKEKKPVGRPRIYFNVEPKVKRPIGRPRTNFDKVKSDSKEKRSRGRPRKYFNVIVKEKRPRGRPKSNLKLDSVLIKRLYNTENLNTSSIRKRGRPRKNSVLESRKSPRIVRTVIKNEVSSIDDIEDDYHRLSVRRKIMQPKRKRGRPRKHFKIDKRHHLPPLDDTSSVDEDSPEDSSEDSEDNWNNVKMEKTTK